MKIFAAFFDGILLGHINNLGFREASSFRPHAASQKQFQSNEKFHHKKRP
jgi:hypothetical protein